jgi:hypothetical protein
MFKKRILTHGEGEGEGEGAREKEGEGERARARERERKLFAAQCVLTDMRPRLRD